MQTHPKIQLFVIDSIAFHFRHDFPDARDRANLLRTMTKELIHPAVNYKMAVSIILVHLIIYHTVWPKLQTLTFLHNLLS